MDHSTADHQTLAWLDLETTGLDEYTDSILEIGIIITPAATNERYPDPLMILAEQSWVVAPNTRTKLAEIDPFVVQMHVENALWIESARHGVLLSQAEEQATDFMTKWEAVGSPMCGSSIRLDRNFLRAQAPALASSFHYRDLDVSSIKNMVKQHLPSMLHAQPFIPPQDKKHRALDDLRTSIAEYRHYLAFFGAPGAR